MSAISTRVRASTSMLLGVLYAWTSLSRADEFVIDQHYDPDFSGIYTTYLIGGFGGGGGGFSPSTTFSPTLASLDFVDLVTQSVDAASASLQVMILRDSTAIAYSDLLQVTNGAIATNRFLFYPGVTLWPGTNYVIQVRTLDNRWSAFGKGDLFFQEGRVIPAQVPPPLTVRASYADVCWSSRTNITYQVQYRSDLTTNVWVDLGTPITGNGLVNCITDAIAGPQKFYRVQVLR